MFDRLIKIINRLLLNTAIIVIIVCLSFGSLLGQSVELASDNQIAAVYDSFVVDDESEQDSREIQVSDASYKRIVNKENAVLCLQTKEVSRKGTLPDKYQKYSSVLFLRLRPKVKTQGSISNNAPGYITYHEGSLTHFPNWISDFRNLQAIDIIGHYDFDLHKGLLKVSNPEKLEYLAISPKSIDNDLIKVLGRFENLKELHIKWNLKKSEGEVLTTLRKMLPECEVGVSLMADYGDFYFLDFEE